MSLVSPPQFVAGMWIAMMAVMMLPGTAPAALRAPRKLSFFAGYLGIWAMFGLAAAFVQFWLESRQLLTGDMALASHFAAGIALIAIGAYQLTPWKHACLQRCRAREVHTLSYSLACLGASWALMGILFVVGVMSYAWIAVLALWIAAEKGLAWGSALAAAAGVGLIAWGAASLLA
jgi:predicted metal-binding membrane protein